MQERILSILFFFIFQEKYFSLGADPVDFRAKDAAPYNHHL